MYATDFCSSGTDHGTQRAARAHRLAPVHSHSPPLQIEDGNAAIGDRNPGPSVVHDHAPTLRSQTGGRSGAAGRGQRKHMLLFDLHF